MAGPMRDRLGDIAGKGGTVAIGSNNTLMSNLVEQKFFESKVFSKKVSDQSGITGP